MRSDVHCDLTDTTTIEWAIVARRGYLLFLFVLASADTAYSHPDKLTKILC